MAALFVDERGVYANQPEVEVWGKSRDARLYPGPHPVVCHSPCARWCRLAGLVEARYGHKRGDDGGCFESALASVRKWGGVLEHPAHSDAWSHFGMPAPNPSGGWQRGICGGWSCHVEQGHYGHRARKATWLYAFGCELPELKWGDSGSRAWISWCSNHTAGNPKGARPADLGFTQAEERAFRSHRPLSPEMSKRKSEWMTATEKATGMKDFRRLTDREAAATPPAFRDVLLAMARSVADAPLLNAATAARSGQA